MNLIKKAFYKLKYKQGALISHFVAHDIRLEIVVLDNSKIEEGILIVKERFTDCLSAAKVKDYKIPGFSEPKTVKIDQIWKWDVNVIREYAR